MNKLWRRPKVTDSASAYKFGRCMKIRVILGHSIFRRHGGVQFFFLPLYHNHFKLYGFIRTRMENCVKESGTPRCILVVGLRLAFSCEEPQHDYYLLFLTHLRRLTNVVNGACTDAARWYNLGRLLASFTYTACTTFFVKIPMMHQAYMRVIWPLGLQFCMKFSVAEEHRINHLAVSFVQHC